MTDAPAVSLPDRDLVLAATPSAAREALRVLFAVDDRLAGIVQTTREAVIGQMRLTWWHDALERLDTEAAPAEPLLHDVERALLPRAVTGAALAAMTDGWEELVVTDPLDAAALAAHADLRGGGLFTLAGRLLGSDHPGLALAGKGWALVDLARHLSVPTLAERAATQARACLTGAFSTRWPASARPIGLLALLALLDQEGLGPVASAWRVTRFRLRGR